MCIFCPKYNETWDLEHVEPQLKKLTSNEIKEVIKTIKFKIGQYEILLSSKHIDGYEAMAIQRSLDNMKTAQYLASRYL